MELFDYLRYRWRVTVAVLLLGVVAILTLGLRSGADYYTAEAQLLVRPPSNQVSAYASDLDRYIDTEMTLVYTPTYLLAEVGETGATPAQLRGALSFRHASGSDEVFFTVSSATAQSAIQLVNAAAEGYIEVSRRRGGTPNADVTAALDEEIDQAQGALDTANLSIKRAGIRFRAANPGQPVPAPSSLTPDAAVRQSLALSRLQALNARQTQLSLDSATVSSRSQLLERAKSAVSPRGWGLTTYGAALVGLALVLLTLAGAGLAVTNRVLSPSRWAAATAGGHLGGAVRVQSVRSSRARPSLRRVAGALARSGGETGPPLMVYLPEKSKALASRNAYLLKTLSDEGISPQEVGSLAELSSSKVVTSDAPILLVVDLSRATVDDASLLTDYPETVQRRMVPVLL